MKELFKKYKKEFDHWLNGGEVLFFTWKWFNSKDNPSSTFNHSAPSAIKYYIINDEFVEIRKALVEGKTVQYNFGNHGINRKDFPNEWKDLDQSIGILADRACPENYRIKPEEPKFKVGDFITVTGTSVSTEQVVKIDGDIIHVRNYGMCYARQATPWQPKKGDWCWFWNEGAIITVLELLEIVDDGNRKYFAAMPNIPHFLGGYYQYCEPFLGKLPTKLRN